MLVERGYIRNSSPITFRSVRLSVQSAYYHHQLTRRLYSICIQWTSELCGNHFAWYREWNHQRRNWKFSQHGLHSIFKRSRLPIPDDEDVRSLTELSDNLFISASTALQYIDCSGSQKAPWCHSRRQQGLFTSRSPTRLWISCTGRY